MRRSNVIFPTILRLFGIISSCRELYTPLEPGGPAQAAGDAAQLGRRTLVTAQAPQVQSSQSG